jgi:hypothetical protein
MPGGSLRQVKIYSVMDGRRTYRDYFDVCLVSGFPRKKWHNCGGLPLLPGASVSH